jgi:hypothetical protein
MSDGISYVGDTGGDAYLDVSFYVGIYENEEHDFIRVGVPGDKSLSIDTIADDQHKRRFARQWEAYKGLKDIKGTPLDEWLEIAETLRHELAYQGFRYIEQVASAPDSAFARMMGGTQLRVKAKSFLNRGKVDADVIIGQQNEQIAELQEQMKQLMSSMNIAPVAKQRTRKSSEPTEIDFAVDVFAELGTVDPAVGQTVKVRMSGSNGWQLLLCYSKSTSIDWTQRYQVIGIENGTLQLSSKLYSFVNNNIGYDSSIYDNTGYDYTASKELRVILNSLKDDILIDTLKSEYLNLFFSIHKA